MYPLEEFLHILVKRRTAYDDLVETASERIDEFCLYLIEYQLVKDMKTEHLANSVFLKNRADFALVNLLNDERNRNYKIRLHLRKSLHNDFRTRHTGQEMHMHTFIELIEHFKHKAVHVCRRQHGYDVRIVVHIRAGNRGKLHVRLNGPVGNHHAFGKSGSPGSVVDEGELLRAVLIVVHV